MELLTDNNGIAPVTVKQQKLFQHINNGQTALEIGTKRIKTEDESDYDSQPEQKKVKYTYSDAEKKDIRLYRLFRRFPGIIQLRNIQFSGKTGINHCVTELTRYLEDQCAENSIIADLVTNMDYHYHFIKQFSNGDEFLSSISNE